MVIRCRLSGWLVSEIQRSLSYICPLPIFLQNPTVEAMARVIEADESAGAPGKLIALQPGKSPGTLFFLNLGIELCRLAHLLDPGPSSFGTIVPLAPATRGDKTDTKTSEVPALKEVAAAHVALIRGHMREPCVLVGYCWGGRLAVEVAQQLLSEGRQVELILLLNAWAIRPTLWQKLKVMTPDGALSSMKFRFDRLWSRVRIGANKTGPAAHPLVPFGELPPHRFVEFVRKTHRMIGLSLDSRAVLFRPSDCRFDGMRGNFGWGGRGLGYCQGSGRPRVHAEWSSLGNTRRRLQECLDQVGVCREGSRRIEWQPSLGRVGFAGLKQLERLPHVFAIDDFRFDSETRGWPGVKTEGVLS